ncbi:MAG: PLP-dependent aminotransferase family protein [Pirellulales bacterium]
MSSLSVRLSSRVASSGEPPISDLMHRALAHPHLISLAAGFVDRQSLPVAETAEAVAALAADGDVARTALQYGTTLGHARLREYVLDDVLAADMQTRAASKVTTERVVLTAGSNQLLHLATECLCDPGDIVLCAAPTYFVYLGLLAGLGVRAIGVEADRDGLIPDAVEAELARRAAAGEARRVKAVYVVSYYDNPSSATLSLDRRSRLLDVVRRWSRDNGQQLFVLEDAAYRELRYDADDLPSVRSFDEAGDTVVYAGTFSKSFSPGLRVGWGILPPALIDPVCHFKGHIDFGSAHFNQVLMARVIESNLYRPHIAQLRDVYRGKLSAMLDACERHLGKLPGVRWHAPHGGLYVWLTLDERLDAGPRGPLFDRAVRAGMLYVPGEFSFAPDGVSPQKNTIRLSFGVQPPEGIEQGIAALAKAIKEAANALPTPDP